MGRLRQMHGQGRQAGLASGCVEFSGLGGRKRLALPTPGVAGEDLGAFAAGSPTLFHGLE